MVDLIQKKREAQPANNKLMSTATAKNRSEARHQQRRVMRRCWAMPSKNTFSIKPIGQFVKKRLAQSKVSIDPFARDKTWATYTNDLNANTESEYHMDASDFLEMLNDASVKADLVMFDPPYSPRQIKECYDDIGKDMEQMDAFRTHWKPERDSINDLLIPGGLVLSFGWNSIGMRKNRGYEIEEILLVCQGPGHNDTICMAERKTQSSLFDENSDPQPAQIELERTTA